MHNCRPDEGFFFQKFRFCGDGDCPDWVLAGIHSQLSALSSIKLRLVAQQVAKTILGESFQEDKLKDAFGIQKKLEMDVPKAAIACLKYLLVNAVRHSADSGTFNEELQQLGLPKEHAAAICKVFDEYGVRLKDELISQSLVVNEFVDVSLNHPESTVDCVQLNFKLKNEICDGKKQSETMHTVNVNKSDIPVLLKELKTIKAIMDEVNYE